jgi:hypothetical protein
MIYLCDKMRHLICIPYSVDNLHKMAIELEIKPHWFHGGKYPHYDIPKKQVDRISKIAQMVSPREILLTIKSHQKEPH